MTDLNFMYKMHVTDMVVGDIKEFLCKTVGLSLHAFTIYTVSIFLQFLNLFLIHYFLC